MYSLFLFPLDAESNASMESVWRTLADKGITSAKGNSPVASSGSKLMEFINYLGCSPVANQLETESLIKLHHFDRTTGLGGESIEKMRYHCCKQPVKDGPALLRQLTEHSSAKCPNCHAEIDASQINLRKSGGFAKLFIEITHIFPKEALPNDLLLKQLSSLTECEWSWFYSKPTI